MDLYQILGVEQKATPEEIKKAFRRKALKYHPDVNSAPDAPEKFKQADLAYRILSNEETRRVYDEHGLHAAHTKLDERGEEHKHQDEGINLEEIMRKVKEKVYREYGEGTREWQRRNHGEKTQRFEELRKKEWQRWTPGLGFYRVMKDSPKDTIILKTFYGEIYHELNLAYNLTLNNPLSLLFIFRLFL